MGRGKHLGRLLGMVALAAPAAAWKWHQRDQERLGLLRKKITGLREQANYVYVNALDATQAAQAEQWKRNLSQVEQALPLLDALSSARRHAEVQHIEKQLLRLEEQVSFAFAQLEQPANTTAGWREEIIDVEIEEDPLAQSQEETE